MSEQNRSFMQALDLWTETNVIDPLLCNDDEPGDYVGGETVEQIQKAIREKVLESYKNGLRNGAGAVRKEQRYAQAQTR